MSLVSTIDFDYLDYVFTAKGGVRNPMLYVEPLDWIIRRMYKSLVVIGGFSGSYKTTYGISMAYNNSIRLGLNTLFISLEMDPEEILMKLLVRHSLSKRLEPYGSKIPYSKCQDAEIMSEEELTFLTKTVSPDMQSKEFGKIFVASAGDFDYSCAGISSLIKNAEDKLALTGCKNLEIGLVVIDYVQLLARFAGYRDGGASNPYRLTGDVAEAMKWLTLNYDDGRGVTIALLSQLSRAAYLAAKDKVKNGRDKVERYKYLYDATSFAESSSLMTAADIAITLYSDDELSKSNKAIMQLIKNRRGKTIEEGFEVLALPDFTYIGDYNLYEESPVGEEDLFDL